MRQIGGIFLFWLMAIAALAQKSEDRKVGPFKAIKVGEAISVLLKKGDKENVRVEVDGVKLSAVLTEVSGNYLKIHMREGNYQGSRKVNCTVTYVTIEKISASAASEVLSEGTLKTTSLDLTAASAASVELTIDAETVNVDVASAGDIRLEGKAKSMRAEASSAGQMDSYNLECEKVNVTASSAGTAKVNATKELDAEASSGGSIRYRGNPGRTNTDSSSGGSVKKSN